MGIEPTAVRRLVAASESDRPVPDSLGQVSVATANASVNPAVGEGRRAFGPSRADDEGGTGRERYPVPMMNATEQAAPS